MKIYTPEYIFMVSCEFFNVAHARCEEIFKDRYDEDEKLFIKLSTPATNLSFAIELLLKSFLLKRLESYPKEHKLFDLYQLVPSGDRKEIETNFNFGKPKMFKYPEVKFVTTDSKNVQGEAFEFTSSKIVNKLKQHNHSFVEWRYLHSFTVEKAEIRYFDFGFMFTFFNVVSIYAENIILH